MLGSAWEWWKWFTSPLFRSRARPGAHLPTSATEQWYLSTNAIKVTVSVLYWYEELFQNTGTIFCGVSPFSFFCHVQVPYQPHPFATPNLLSKHISLISLADFNDERILAQSTIPARKESAASVSRTIGCDFSLCRLFWPGMAELGQNSRHSEKPQPIVRETEAADSHRARFGFRHL